DTRVAGSVERVSDPTQFKILKSWLRHHRITHLGFSYRLDPQQAFRVFSRLLQRIDEDETLSPKKGGLIREVFFAGLPEACDIIVREYGARIKTFRGDETAQETLLRIGIPDSRIPRRIREQSVYDELRLDFGKTLILREKHLQVKPEPLPQYPEFGTSRDHLIHRLSWARSHNRLPLFRVHAGPYHEDRERALAVFSEWLRKLARGGFLDIVSVGSSQLSQSHFGQDWGDLPNGGGVPVNSEMELRAIREDASPMLVRAYSATNNILAVARILEKNLNMAWHALSLWWFNCLDGRGPLSLAESLAEHIKTIRYVAGVRKPYEPNTPHHFAFRGSDDITSVVSGYLAAKTAKIQGIRSLVLQNMMNTPKSTSGLQDLAKSRALLRLVRSLEDRNFRVIYQPRAGLDYFSPDPEKARAQLAAVTALMRDVEPDRPANLQIVHVVSYSEAMFLATPDVIQESIQITKAALQFYPDFRSRNDLSQLTESPDVQAQTEALVEDARALISDMEHTIQNLYSP
ncbi:MAG: cobalamin-binding protein, partial [Candidatus Aminicenantales bacterium]